jgi:hypothetical protein
LASAYVSAAVAALSYCQIAFDPGTSTQAIL